MCVVWKAASRVQTMGGMTPCRLCSEQSLNETHIPPNGGDQNEILNATRVNPEVTDRQDGLVATLPSYKNLLIQKREMLRGQPTPPHPRPQSRCKVLRAGLTIP